MGQAREYPLQQIEEDGRGHGSANVDSPVPHESQLKYCAWCLCKQDTRESRSLVNYLSLANRCMTQTYLTILWEVHREDACNPPMQLLNWRLNFFFFLLLFFIHWGISRVRGLFNDNSLTRFICFYFGFYCLYLETRHFSPPLRQNESLSAKLPSRRVVLLEVRMKMRWQEEPTGFLDQGQIRENRKKYRFSLGTKHTVRSLPADTAPYSSSSSSSFLPSSPADGVPFRSKRATSLSRVDGVVGGWRLCLCLLVRKVIID